MITRHLISAELIKRVVLTQWRSTAPFFFAVIVVVVVVVVMCAPIKHKYLIMNAIWGAFFFF